jgi:hypothetical protein
MKHRCDLRGFVFYVAKHVARECPVLIINPFDNLLVIQINLVKNVVS